MKSDEWEALWAPPILFIGMIVFVSQIASDVVGVLSFGMRNTMNVSLPDDLKEWVSEQVQAGGYGTASEFLRDMLRRARQRQQRRELDETLVAAVESGADVVMDDAEWASIRSAARSAGKKQRRKQQ